MNKTSEKHDTMVVFDEKGAFVKSWGAEFEGGAHGLHIHKEGRDEFLYLCDTKRALVTKTTLSGEKVFTLEYPKESPAYGAAKIKYSPTNIAIAPNGDFWVGDGYGAFYMFHYTVASPTAFPKLKNTFGGPPAGAAPAAAVAARKK